MRLRVRVALPQDTEGILFKVAAISGVAHAVGLAVFSLMPRFGGQPDLPRATIATIVPASALMPPAPPPRAPAGPTPTQRAEEARRAAEAPRRTPPARPIPPPPGSARKKKEEAPPRPAAVDPPPPVVAPQPPPGPTAPPASPDGGADASGISFGDAGSASLEGIPSIGSSIFPYDYYRASLVAILQSNWRRPVAPEGLGGILECRVRFTIMKSGIIQEPRIAAPSGNPTLDQSALRAVYDSSPLPPLPVQYGHASVSAEVVFELTPD